MSLNYETKVGIIGHCGLHGTWMGFIWKVFYSLRSGNCFHFSHLSVFSRDKLKKKEGPVLLMKEISNLKRRYNDCHLSLSLARLEGSLSRFMRHSAVLFENAHIHPLLSRLVWVFQCPLGREEIEAQLDGGNENFALFATSCQRNDASEVDTVVVDDWW